MITFPRRTSRRLLAGALATAAVAAVVTPALGAEPSTRTLRFYEVTNAFSLTDAAGHVKPPGPPAAGDILDVSGNLYVGDHRHHGRRVVGTDHTRCVFTGPETGTCQGEVALGNSLLLVRSALGGNPFQVWYGTGRYTGATGTGSTTSIGDTNNSDVVVRLRKAG
jgi:hypothetical protein